MRRTGIQSEVLASLALVMVLSTLLLTAVWAVRHEASLRLVLGRGLLAQADAPPGTPALLSGTEWWRIGPDGQARPRGPTARPIDAESRRLADEARVARAPLVLPGPPWGPIRFAAPRDDGVGVDVARVPAVTARALRWAPLGAAAFVLVANAVIFTALGAVVLRRRVLGPMLRLRDAAARLAEGDEGVRAPVEGTAEVADLGRTFNEMTDALEARSEALRKAVVDLREANEALRQTRDGLDRAERLASVGRLASGVAHEVGNPIGAILALVDLAGRDPALSDESRAHLSRAARQGERVRTILRQLLDFSRPPSGRPGAVALAALAEETLALVAAQRRYAEVEFSLAPCAGAPMARADAALMAQVLLNLVINAADAVVETGGPGRVEVGLHVGVLHRRPNDPPGFVPPRRQPDAVECVVADTGVGIPDEDRERIFDPFFTTKPPGQGTGLGLANAARLAEEQGGRLELVEAPGGFTTAFGLRLPSAASAGRGSAVRAGDTEAPGAGS